MVQTARAASGTRLAAYATKGSPAVAALTGSDVVICQIAGSPPAAARIRQAVRCVVVPPRITRRVIAKVREAPPSGVAAQNLVSRCRVVIA